MLAIRDAAPGDTPGILAILEPEILSGIAHFATVPPPLEDLRRDLVSPHLPWLVAIDEPQAARDAPFIVGYARASPWKTREAYRWTAEIGVYIREDHRGRGIGAALYQQLFPRLEAAGIRTLLAGIALPNPASIRLHERAGMKHVGTLPRVGCKFGRWLDVGYWHRTLA